MARVVTLIIVPFSIYVLFFQIHFLILSKGGTGSGFMSPEFQSSLHGNEISSTFAGNINIFIMNVFK